MFKLTRQRGGVWYAGGTVKVGKEKRAVEEHSTGERERGAAEDYVAQRREDIRHEILYGVPRRPTLISFAHAGTLYLNRPEGLHPNDAWRIGELNEVLGDCVLNPPSSDAGGEIEDIFDGWARFKSERCAGLAPATVNRFRDTLQAAINYPAVELKYTPPKIPRIKFRNERIRWLTLADADRLIASYVPHVQLPMRNYRYQGMRTQECLQLQWSNVDMRRETFFLDDTKNGEPRTVKMHPRVAEDIWTVWKGRGHPDEGHVYLNRLGRPYADTRRYKLPGGNPLSSAHRTAMRRAQVHPNGGPDFTVHDWRHHWASWMVMEGADLVTIKRLGGWKKIEMVERYAALSDEHMARAIMRLK